MIQLFELPESFRTDWEDSDIGYADVFMRSQGMQSCKWVIEDGTRSRWEMSEEDYSWFILRWM